LQKGGQHLEYRQRRAFRRGVRFSREWEGKDKKKLHPYILTDPPKKSEVYLLHGYGPGLGVLRPQGGKKEQKLQGANQPGIFKKRRGNVCKIDVQTVDNFRGK